MDAPTPLERRLRAASYAKFSHQAARVLDGIGVGEGRRRMLDVAEVDVIWPRYLSRLRLGDNARERWPASEIGEVRRRVDDLRLAIGELTMVWFAHVEVEPVAFEVPGEQVLAAGLDYLVSPAGDLMLTTVDVSEGVCVEMNKLSTGEEFEIVSWGRFVR